MDPQTFMDIATKVTKLKMYPYFDIAHYTLMCMAVRDDMPSNQPSGMPLLSPLVFLNWSHYDVNLLS